QVSGPRLLQGRTRPRISRKPAPFAQDAPGLTACPVARLGRWQDGLRKTPPSFHSRRRQCARRTGRMGLGKRQVFMK
ncbi:hypothetical protein, partial [Gluconobacter sp. P1D12_c]